MDVRELMRRERDSQRGVSLIETLVSLLLIAMAVLAAAPMFVHAIQGRDVGADYSQVGARAVARMEILRATDYSDPALAIGGSMVSNWSNGTIDYFDASDPDYAVRWTIAAHPTIADAKVINVQALAWDPSVGAIKQVTLATVRGE